MDDIVRAALKKWPQVPHCWGWLALDARGDWYMRDERIQAAGPFPQVKGSRIEHDKLRQFIHRNYGHDEQGAWYFQNGPQRVYVELEASPWIWRVGPAPMPMQPAAGPGAGQPVVHSHTGLAVQQVHSAWLDEFGRLFLHTPLGLGLVHSMDMLHAAQAVEAGLWQPQALPFAELPVRWAYQLRPQRPGQAGVGG